MKKWKKLAPVLLSLIAVFCMTGVTSYGADSKKITSVTLTVKSEINIGDDLGQYDIEIEPASGKYSVDTIEVENDGFEWEPDMVPKIKVYLAADEGYYFSLTSSKIKLTGATYVTAIKQDSSRILVITMTLPSLAEHAVAVNSVTLSENGSATWEAAPNAGSYELRLMRDGTNVGNSRMATETSYDFSAMMGKSANYKVRIRAINDINPNSKSEWTESNTVYISAEAAVKLRNSSTVPVTEDTNGTWKHDDQGWWYRNGNNSFTINNWQLIDGKWYYFNEKGYMVTGWINWQGQWYYCNTDGSMMTDGVTPDGYRIGPDGVMVQ